MSKRRMQLQLQSQTADHKNQEQQSQLQSQMQQCTALAIAMRDYTIKHPEVVSEAQRSLISNTIKWGATGPRYKVLREVAYEINPRLLRIVDR